VPATRTSRLKESLETFHGAWRNPQLRRLELAWASALIGQWAYGVAIAVYAYQIGGAGLVGIASFGRMLPAAVAAPFAGLLADRYRREHVMVISNVFAAFALVGAAAAILADAPPIVALTLAGVVSLTGSAFRPAQAALLPSLAGTPEELTAANALSSTIESAGIFMGPALGGLILVAAGTGEVFATSAALLLGSALLLTGIRSEAPQTPAAKPAQGIIHETLAGFRALAAESSVRPVVGLFLAQTLVDGFLNVLEVVVALELLDMGRSGVGFLNSAVGAGALLGGLVAVGALKPERLSRTLRVGIFLWGTPIALIALWPQVGVALVLFAVVGVANTLVDVSAFTLLQRALPDEVLARAFGAIQSLWIGTLALGTLAAPLLVSGVGVRGALLVVGSFLPVLVILTWSRLSKLDVVPEVVAQRTELLRSIPIFAPLPLPALEHLAASLIPLKYSAGQEVVQQGQGGDRFYLVRSGEVRVSVDGRPVQTQGPGEYFGEIALLRDIPRTATVRAERDAELYALERDEFIAAVTGHAESIEAADAAVAARLARARPAVVAL
jgi:MFS family permease